ncbi:MAG: protein kinase, partial [Phycisphaeraceae bacterium]
MTDSLARLSTALADRYEIQEEIGAGGMATVYLAQDLKHDRKVAVKVLRPELAAVLGAERFVQEIKTTANLQHPHILPLFDSGEADSFLYYVMPFIDGETLRDKLNRETQLGIEEAVRITADIADALGYAHRNNVIHRDIKPENILLHDGRPMVADFGIALAVSAAAGGRMTETGLSLGTPHYMSPEQATAEKDLTNRSDIYSLGSVLYEMLTGEPPHMGNSAQQIIMKIVTDTARPVMELRKSVPPHVAAATAKSLEKLPADRFATAGEFSQALGDQAYTVTPAGVARAAGMQDLWKRRAVAAIGVAAVMTVLFAWSLVRPPAEPVSSAMRFAFSMGSPSRGVLDVAISPDGQSVAQAYTDSAGQLRLALRDFATTTIRMVAGTEGGDKPFFSRDGQWIGFRENGGLKKVPVGGGAAIDITDSCFDGSWAPDDVIVCVSSATWGLARVSANGGDLEQLT